MTANKYMLLSYANKLTDAIIEMLNRNLIDEKALKKINEKFLNYIKVRFMTVEVQDEKKQKKHVLNEIYEILTTGIKMDFGVVKLSLDEAIEIIELKNKLQALEKEVR